MTASGSEPSGNVREFHHRILLAKNRDRARGFLRKEIAGLAGLKAADRVYTRFGYLWGRLDAAAFEQEYASRGPAAWIRAVLDSHTIDDAAVFSVDRLRPPSPGRHFEMRVSWSASDEVTAYREGGGVSRQAVCRRLTAYLAGAVSYCLGARVYFVEESCRVRGDDHCAAVARDEAYMKAKAKGVLALYDIADIEKVTFRKEQSSRKGAGVPDRVETREDSARPELSPLIATAYSHAMKDVLEMAKRVAPFDSSVLITGETGTGKEVLARFIHSRSGRAKSPMLAVNCSALPETLLESELFGHKAGSFTGAIRDRVGLFEQAARGSILLDEIGDISPVIQIKLIRVLQEREILRIGENIPRKVDTRIIAATNRSLGAAVTAGTFREDLLYRLRVIEITMPPLRQRTEDIVPLTEYFLGSLARRLKLPHLTLEGACLDYFKAYRWPGNVRELQNILERAAVLSDGGRIRPRHLPPYLLRPEIRDTVAVGPEMRTLAEMELDHIRAVLRSTGGNRARAAKILGIGLATLWRKLKNASPPDRGAED